MDWEVFIDTRTYSIPDLMEVAPVLLSHEARLPDQNRHFISVTPIILYVRCFPWLPPLADFLLPLISKRLAELKRECVCGDVGRLLT